MLVPNLNTNPENIANKYAQIKMNKIIVVLAYLMTRKH